MFRRLSLLAGRRPPVRLAIGLLLFALCQTQTSRAQEEEEAATLPADANTTCPVMPEEESDPEFTVDYKGRRIYLCCSRCKRLFNQDPEKYLALLVPAPAGADTLSTAPAAAVQSPDPDTTQSSNSGTTDVAETATLPSALEPSTAEEPAEAAVSAPSDENPGGLRTTRTASESLSTLQRVTRYTGRLHAVAVHFPIGLLLGSAMVEAVAVIRRRRVGSEGARLTLGLGTLGAVAAVPLGWINAAFSQHPGLEHYVEWHRWSGTAAGLAAVVAWFLARTAHSGRPAAEKAYLTALFAGAVLLILSGHFGAALIYGPDYLKPY